MKKVMEFIENLSPILISPARSSLTISISKRFFLFRLMNRIIDIMEEDPHTSFVALLKSYKILGRILNGTLKEFYRDRNKLYFKNFFADRKLWAIVKADIEGLYPKHKDIRMTITKNGVIVYDNYKANSFNVLLFTIHAGSWVPEKIEKKFSISTRYRISEEDTDTDKIYRNLVLDKAGIWIDNKQSRFVIDFNRSIEVAIYDDYRIDKDGNSYLSPVWKEDLNKNEYRTIFSSYKEFYFIVARLVDTYKFNIIFDGHSMRDDPTRPVMSFGARYIPNFYMPIVKSMQQKVISMGYKPCLINQPFGGGFILRWLSSKFPNTFIFSMEVNKKLYMNKSRTKSIMSKLKKVRDDLTNIFDIDPPAEKNIKFPEKKTRITKGGEFLKNNKNIFG